MYLLVYHLPNVDYSERGSVLYIQAGGRLLPQTVIYTVSDYGGEKWYFTEEGLRYIHDSRRRRISQRFVLDYLHQIPIIMRSPAIVARKPGDENFLYCKPVTIKEFSFHPRLLIVVGKKSNLNVIWNFFWQEQNRLPREAAEIVYRASARYRKYMG